MENLVKQRSITSGPGQEESSSAWERWPLQQTAESLAVIGNKVQEWFQCQFSWQMKQDYDARDAEIAAAVAAAALAIYSLQEAEAEANAEYTRKKREDLEISRTKLKSKKQDTRTGIPSSGRVSPHFSSTRVLSDMDHRMRRPSVRSTTPMAIDQNHGGIKNVETMADSWERAQMEKLIKRYEKMKSAILAWENKKKMQAKLKMERNKIELEQRRAVNQKHYQNKIARIEHTARGAREQADQERRKKESEIKQKAKEFKSRGKGPVKYCSAVKYMIYIFPQS